MNADSKGYEYDDDGERLEAIQSIESDERHFYIPSEENSCPPS